MKECSSAIPPPLNPTTSSSKTARSILMDSQKYSDGFAKVTAPTGWWRPSYLDDYNDTDTTQQSSSNAFDSSSLWQEGTTLGDMIIPSPIKQCISGIGGVYEFTMLELPSITVAKYQAMARTYKDKQVYSRFKASSSHLGNQSLDKMDDEDQSDERMDELARFYWRRLGPTMEASVYGADMEGSLFRGDSACGWNVGHLDSCLQLLRADRPAQSELLGVTSPYLYFGMWASTFAAHKEDMNLCSINYLHAGAPKYWYAIAAEDTERFETLMASYFFDASRSCSEYMRHKRYLISPAILSKAGITYTTQIQRAGDFIITFPGCYHFGFNTGFNVAESTNFAVPEWVTLGEKANVCLCHPHSVRIEMNRFKGLLQQYEVSTCLQQGKKLNYIEWAKAEERKRKDMRNILSPPHICKSETVVQSNGFVVDVFKMSLDRRLDANDSKGTKKRKLKSSNCEEMCANRRLARISGKGSFVLGTHVICLLPSSNQELKYFSGVVEKCVEHNLRIHFDGTTRKDDMWIVDSD